MLHSSTAIVALSAEAGCSGRLVACGGICTDLQSDPAHCGACGNACPPSSSCVDGTCECECPAGLLLCGPGCHCFDTTNDPNHCGSCAACPTGAQCVRSLCTCPQGQVVCNGACTDTQVDPANCGGCGVHCPPGTQCVDGACSGPQPFHCGNVSCDANTQYCRITSGGCKTSGQLCVMSSDCCSMQCQWDSSRKEAVCYPLPPPDAGVGGSSICVALPLACTTSPPTCACVLAQDPCGAVPPTFCSQSQGGVTRGSYGGSPPRSGWRYLYGVNVQKPLEAAKLGEDDL